MRSPHVVEWVAGAWQAECQPADGARLSRLRWRGVDLLTPPPDDFRPPRRDLGRYETRAVYGYDDCFPTVDPGRFPGLAWDVPDHGELCWLPWQVEVEDGRLVCRVESRHLPVAFTRSLAATGDCLSWQFQVHNRGDAPVPGLHVMHALLPVDAVADLELPPCRQVLDEIGDRGLDLPGPTAVRDYLLGLPAGRATMLLLRGVERGQVTVRRRDGIALDVRFPAEPFPTLGIWWNRAGYPDEDGCRRSECAFEPIPGLYSSLARSQALGRTLVVPPHACLGWTVEWSLSRE